MRDSQDVKAAQHSARQANPDPGRPNPSDPEGFVCAFLSMMEARDLDAAETMLAPGFSMTFPSGRDFTTLADLVAWAKGRYRFVAKKIDTVEIAKNADSTTAFVIGTLYGEWPDGTAFDGIRFIDRFVVKDVGILHQDVWNDLAEHSDGSAAER